MNRAHLYSQNQRACQERFVPPRHFDDGLLPKSPIDVQADLTCNIRNNVLTLHAVQKGTPRVVRIQLGDWQRDLPGLRLVKAGKSASGIWMGRQESISGVSPIAMARSLEPEVVYFGAFVHKTLRFLGRVGPLPSDSELRLIRHALDIPRINGKLISFDGRSTANLMWYDLQAAGPVFVDEDFLNSFHWFDLEGK